MTIAYFNHSFLRREAGSPKAHAAAAYISGTKLEYTPVDVADYSNRQGVLHSEIWAPEDAPEWARNRGEFWRRLEAREDKTTRRANAILAHKFVAALPHELPFEELLLLCKDFIRENFTRKGYVADWAIHAPDRDGDARNFHLHIMAPLRRMEGHSFSKHKDRFPKNSPAMSEYTRGMQKKFFLLINRYLAKNGFCNRIELINQKWSLTAVLEKRLPTPIVGTPPMVSITKPDIAMEMLTGKKLEKAVDLSLSSVNETSGWPMDAVLDWRDWGHKNPIKFFTKWPELKPNSWFSSHKK